MRLSSTLTRLLLLLVASVLGLTFILNFWGSTWLGKTKSPPSSVKTLPPLVLWAWERPEDLRHIDPKKVAVAFLSRTIYLRAGDTFVKPRLQPLHLPPDVALIAVARIESDRKLHPLLHERQFEQTVQAVTDIASQANVLGVQIDFDATISERDFYRRLIQRVRSRLPDTTQLSITALASWCAGDNWLDSLPIDEAIPMLFRMGVDENKFRAQAASGVPFSAKKCQHSVGVSTDEPLDTKFSAARSYVFNPKPWSPESVTRLQNP